MESSDSSTRRSSEVANYNVSPRFVANTLGKLRQANLLGLSADTSGHLCPDCMRVSPAHLQRPDGCRTLSNVWQLEETSGLCDLCAIIFDVICRAGCNGTDNWHQGFEKALEQQCIERNVSASLILRSDGRTVDICFGIDQKVVPPRWAKSLRIYTDVDMNDASRLTHEYSYVAQGDHVSRQLDLDKLEILGKAWIEECQSNHPECSSEPSALVPQLPTRILDLREVGRTRRIRLWHSKGARGHYVALSHSWGGSQPAKTTKANLDARCESLELGELPRTFNDALQVTLRLGFSFLWIDSLCIVQDDVEDWKTESVRMGDLYRNASVTVAATRAKNSEAGFLGPRERTRVAKIPRNSIDDEAGALNVYIGHRRSFEDDVDNGPLNKRAWVFQERILSPRTLHFTKSQVYWECWTKHHGEDLESNFLGIMKDRKYPMILAPCGAGIDAVDKESTPHAWWYMLNQYSKCQLSFQSDKLVAITGLVDNIASQTEVRFIKGLWEDSVHTGLLWSAVNPPMETLVEVEAPSWSWASRKGAIDHIQLYSFQVNAKVELVERSDHGTPVLRGSVTRLRSDFKVGDLRMSESTADHVNFPPELDENTHSHYRAIVCEHTKFSTVSPYGDVYGWMALDADDGSEPDISSVRWMIVAGQMHDDSDEDGEDEISVTAADSDISLWARYFVLVRQYGDGRWRRVGVAAMYSEGCFDTVVYEQVVDVT